MTPPAAKAASFTYVEFTPIASAAASSSRSAAKARPMREPLTRAKK